MKRPIPEALIPYRRRFKNALEKSYDWRKSFKENYEFYYGKQWRDEDLRTLRKQKRPAMTINKIKPLINLLSGYQRLNRFEPDFLPRSSEDIKVCKISKGITKFVFDATDFDEIESAVFTDGIIGGRGWFDVKYKWDYETLDGDVFIGRVSPLDIFVDPESKEPDCSDAQYMCRAKWVPVDTLKVLYPEHGEEIEDIAQYYGSQDYEQDFIEYEPLWYLAEKKMVRVVEFWYKKTEPIKYYVLKDGTVAEASKIDPNFKEAIMALVKKSVVLPKHKMKVITFLGDLELEHKNSPYKHNDFPFVPYNAYFIPEAGGPQGVVHDLKDPQREINKRRSQMLHIINTMANSGWKYRAGTLDDANKKKLENLGSMPGVVIEHIGEAPQEIVPKPVPVNVIQAEIMSVQDIQQISGINEAMLGQSVPAGTSGKALEFRQRQAITQVAILFDNLRQSKKRILRLLWGKKNKPGLIPQFYTEEKTIRILGEDGKHEFVVVNQQVPMATPMGTVMQVVNDLSATDFDIIISETPASPTARMSQFYALLEAIKYGVPVPPDMLIDASDWPQKEEMKNRMVQQQQQQQAMMEQQAQAEQARAAQQSEGVAFKRKLDTAKFMARYADKLREAQGLAGQGLQSPQTYHQNVDILQGSL